MTVRQGRFEWDSEKDKRNVKNHGLSFSEILGVFDDPYFYEIYDENHSDGDEARYNGLGYAQRRFRIVQVVYTEDARIRVISARPATSRERKMYYDRLREIYRGP